MQDLISAASGGSAGGGSGRVPVLHTDIILVDFVGFSTLDDAGQFVSMSVVSRLMGGIMDRLAVQSFGKKVDMAIGWVPTGDGFYIILNPKVIGTAIFVALFLRQALMTRVNQTVGLKGVCVAVHHGTAVPFDDVTGKRNYIGTGLNDAARLLALKPEEAVMARNFHRDDNFFIASEAALDHFYMVYPQDEIQSFLDMNGWRQSVKFRLTDKHGKVHPYVFIDIHRDATMNIPKVVNPFNEAGLVS